MAQQGGIPVLPNDIPDDDVSKRTAYHVLKPIAALGKYFGLVPLSGLYEKTGPDGPTGGFRRQLLDNILPLAAFCLEIFMGYNVMKLLISCAERGMDKGVNYWTIILINFSIVVQSPGCVLLFWIRAKALVQYIRGFDQVEVLLKHKRRSMVIYAFCMMVGTLFFLCMKTPSWISMLRLHLLQFNVNPREWYPSGTFELAFACFSLSMLLVALVQCTPELIYIFFQSLLKTGFQTLNEEIRKNQPCVDEPHEWIDDGVPEVQKIRRYRQLHQSLCDLAGQLDGLLSPAILVSYLSSIIVGIVCWYWLLDQFLRVEKPDFGISFALTNVGLFSFLIISVLSGSAHSTAHAAAAIVPSIYASMKLDTFEAREEVQIFALKDQSKVLKFSASGFFFLDRSVITTVVGAVCTYVVVMMQFQTEPTV